MTEIFSHFFNLVLAKFVCCQNSLKCKQRLTHSPRVWAAGLQSADKMMAGRGEEYEGCLTSALRALHCSCVAVACVLRVLMRAQQRFNLSYENICTRLAATDVIELKSG